jgi:hypothetical protein
MSTYYASSVYTILAYARKALFQPTGVTDNRLNPSPFVGAYEINSKRPEVSVVSSI